MNGRGPLEKWARPDFRGQSLVEANFAGADVRGADFTDADLRGADFTGARLGVAPREGIVILGAAMLISIIAGATIGLVVFDIRGQLRSDEWDEAASGSSLIFLLLVFVAVIVWSGFDLALRLTAALYVIVLLGNIVANLIWDNVELVRVARGTALLIVVFLAILAGLLGREVGGVFGSWSIVIVALAGSVATGQSEGGLTGVIVALSLAVVAKRALRGDQRDRTLRRVSHRLVRKWGTSFANADLTDADFTGAHASRCGVEGARLDRVTWDPDLPLPIDLPDGTRPPGR